MSCFGGVAMRGGSRSRPWRAKCAGIAATVGSRLRRSIKGLRRRRRATSSVMHHRRQYSTSLAPVYADELYNHHQQQPSSGKLVAANTTNTVGARAGGKPRAAAAGVGAMRNILMRSPGRGGGVLGAVKGMGEVDLRAELFIRKFKEDMRLQSQRSAEEFQAMLARGL